MKLYRVAGKKLIVHDDDLFIQAEGGKIVPATQIALPTKPSKHESMTIRRCKSCGKPGHRADGCHAFGDRGGVPDDLEAQIEALREEEPGINSKAVAERLGVSLAQVNKHW